MSQQRLLKNTFLYFVGTLATRLLNFLFLPLYTERIPAADFGYYGFVYSMLSVVMPSLFFMVWDVFLRFTLDEKTDEGRERVASTVLLCTGALFLAYGALFVAVGLLHPVRDLWLILLVSFTWLLAYIWQSGMRAHGHNRLYAIGGVAATAVTVTVNLVFILVLRWHSVTLYAAQAASFLTVFLLAERKLRLLRRVRLSLFDRALLMRMLRFGGPLIFNSIAFWMVNGIGSLVIKVNMGDAAVGYFSAAGRFSMIVATMTQIVYYAWQEEAFREAGSDALQGYASQVLGHYCRVLLGGVACGLPALALVVPWVIDSAYQPAWALVPAVVLTAVYSALSSFAGTVYSAKMRTADILSTTIVGGVLSLALSWFGVQLFGMQAVAAAGGVGFLAVFLLRVAFSRRAAPLRVDWPLFALLNLAAGAGVALYFVGDAWVKLAASALGFVWFLWLNRALLRGALGALKRRGK